MLWVWRNMRNSSPGTDGAAQEVARSGLHTISGNLGCSGYTRAGCSRAAASQSSVALATEDRSLIAPLTFAVSKARWQAVSWHQERPIFVSRLGRLQSRPSFSAIGNLQPRQNGAILWHGLAAMPSFRLAHPSENRSCSQPENMSPHWWGSLHALVRIRPFRSRNLWEIVWELASLPDYSEVVCPHLFELPRKDPFRRKAKVKPSSRHS